ncbi:uncharacterized protein, partial [Macaca fascicularis]|uniref:uncharacterized protein n=1 Tax=Macaca fascicularis TaxID=9541 RepID=UPI0032B07DEB
TYPPPVTPPVPGNFVCLHHGWWQLLPHWSLHPSPISCSPQDAVGSFCRGDTVLFFPGPCPFFAAVCTALRAWHGWPTASLYTWPLEDEASATLAFLWVQEGAHPSPGAPLTGSTPPFTWTPPPFTWSTPSLHLEHPSPGAPLPSPGAPLQRPSPRAPLPGTCPHAEHPYLRAPFTWSTPLLAPCLEHSLATCTWVTTCLSDLG